MYTIYLVKGRHYTGRPASPPHVQSSEPQTRCTSEKHAPYVCVCVKRLQTQDLREEREIQPCPACGGSVVLVWWRCGGAVAVLQRNDSLTVQS